MWCGGKIPADIHVYVDSPMAQRICKLYPEDDELWDKVYHWGNLKFIADNAETLALQASKAPMVVLSSAGMLSGGKSVSWAKAFAPDPNAHIIFCGYSSQNTLASQIRYGQTKIAESLGATVENNQYNMISVRPDLERTLFVFSYQSVKKTTSRESLT